MNFRIHFLKSFSVGSLKPNHAVRGITREPITLGATLSQRDLQRLVAEMID